MTPYYPEAACLICRLNFAGQRKMKHEICNGKNEMLNTGKRDRKSWKAKYPHQLKKTNWRLKKDKIICDPVSVFCLLLIIL